MKMTLVLTSQNRTEELRRFVCSLNNQKDIDFSQLQLIFVDQGNNEFVFENLNCLIKFDCIKSGRCSLSHARNIALPHVEGKYVCFPDDDCWYESDTLSRVYSILDQERYQIVSGKGLNEKGLPTSVFPKVNSVISSTHRCAAISYTLFFKFVPDVFFDENMGVGSKYNIGAGEETDYLLTLIEKKNYNAYYDTNIIVHHPIQEDTYDKPYLLKKFYSYSRGGGYLMQKHNFTFMYKIKQLGRPLVGSIFFFLTGNIFRSQKSFFMFKGKLEGLFFKIPSDS